MLIFVAMLVDRTCCWGLLSDQGEGQRWPLVGLTLAGSDNMLLVSGTATKGVRWVFGIFGYAMNWVLLGLQEL